MPVDSFSLKSISVPANTTPESTRVFEYFSKNHDRWSKMLLKHSENTLTLQSNGDVTITSSSTADGSKPSSNTVPSYNLRDVIQNTTRDHPQMFPVPPKSGSDELVSQSTSHEALQVVSPPTIDIHNPRKSILHNKDFSYLRSKMKNLKLNGKVKAEQTSVSPEKIDNVPTAQNSTSRTSQYSMDPNPKFFSFMDPLKNGGVSTKTEGLTTREDGSLPPASEASKEPSKLNDSLSTKSIQGRVKAEPKKPSVVSTNTEKTSKSSVPDTSNPKSSHKYIQLTSAPKPKRSASEEGFSLYGTKDEEGLCTYEGDEYSDDYQDDYDIEEIDDDLYDGPREHHIELELQPECDIHGVEGCDCPMYEDGYEQEESYDFTFEYNSEGKLVPTEGSVKEYFRAQANGLRADGRFQPSNGKIMELEKKKKQKKKAKKSKEKRKPVFDADATDFCLLCDYEALYGKPPINLMKWVDQKLQEEDEKRERIKKKLQDAKSQAIKRQQEMNE
ncbi:hypothetical protein CANTEDRAFT_136905 [Yamadazyma tenuis ATCC 10573]|uniref:Uncharacterized protein n=1 Tax=Candida tenuis (strain ATCC 10573 / BCRC 21748 / CBS 615 / JCM 9827 / NBRC 10315 / NRRL Y-1498 / VKM Y-70) TaxID=590646 RepID=G3BDZ8_CANTC|nr:uncharacterized protein CANTEDRAFT_136905 [Yamadazyma tenuis ATCC 10573]EGV60418.1 hypothetical protein CANTEDRAFT_136905 [Yamadazyma tenuis ATCC 10573]